MDQNPAYRVNQQQGPAVEQNPAYGVSDQQPDYYENEPDYYTSVDHNPALSTEVHQLSSAHSSAGVSAAPAPPSSVGSPSPLYCSV